MNPSDVVVMMNKRGRVVRVKGWEVDNLKQYQGMRVLPFIPKKEYYPEFDEELTHKAPEFTSPINEDILEGDEV